MGKQFYRLFAVGVLALTAIFLTSKPLVGQEKFPSKTIEAVNMFGPGGGTDIFVRTLAMDARRILKAPIVVTNMTAGQGVGATKYVLDQSADGYTLLAFGPEQIFNAILGRIDYKEFEKKLEIEGVVRVSRQMKGKRRVELVEQPQRST